MKNNYLTYHKWGTKRVYYQNLIFKYSTSGKYFLFKSNLNEIEKIAKKITNLVYNSPKNKITRLELAKLQKESQILIDSLESDLMLLVLYDS